MKTDPLGNPVEGDQCGGLGGDPAVAPGGGDAVQGDRSTVEDFKERGAAIKELKRRDVRIVSEPRDVPGLALRFAFFSDPWGNLIELTQTIPLASEPEKSVL